jgi:hypothetical protein
MKLNPILEATNRSAIQDISDLLHIPKYGYRDHRSLQAWNQTLSALWDNSFYMHMEVPPSLN